VNVSKLKTHIQRRLPECKYNKKKSKHAIELCYATLLIEDTEPKGIRWEFDEPNYEHVFGDMYIVQTAIYLGAKIMTKDRKLSQMASYADIKCCHVPEIGR
jgi:predicted nucleic acid-binding protein